MHDRIKSLLSELKAGLKRIYHDRLHGVYLYGSYARGEADSDSDVDVLIVLDHLERYESEIERTSHLNEQGLRFRRHSRVHAALHVMLQARA